MVKRRRENEDKDERKEGGREGELGKDGEWEGGKEGKQLRNYKERRKGLRLKKIQFREDILSCLIRMRVFIVFKHFTTSTIWLRVNPSLTVTLCSFLITGRNFLLYSPRMSLSSLASS